MFVAESRRSAQREGRHEIMHEFRYKRYSVPLFHLRIVCIYFSFIYSCITEKYLYFWNTGIIANWIIYQKQHLSQSIFLIFFLFIWLES